MRSRWFVYLALSALLLAGTACEKWFGPDKKGEITLSSETFGDSYYLFGYSYDKGDFYKYPFQGEVEPDIINEGERQLVGGEVVVLPSLNTPGRVNGFALVGEFSNLEDARTFFDDYKKVDGDLAFVIVTQVVELYQVWVQKTGDGKYVKLLVKDVENLENENGVPYNKVVLKFVYQSDGSASFPD